MYVVYCFGFVSFSSLVYGVGKTRGKRNYMEDVDFALESIRVKDKATAAAYGANLLYVCMYICLYV